MRVSALARIDCVISIGSTDGGANVGSFKVETSAFVEISPFIPELMSGCSVAIVSGVVAMDCSSVASCVSAFSSGVASESELEFDGQPRPFHHRPRLFESMGCFEAERL